VGGERGEKPERGEPGPEKAMNPLKPGGGSAGLEKGKKGEKEKEKEKER
jgi:hypothetical protein